MNSLVTWPALLCSRSLSLSLYVCLSLTLSVCLSVCVSAQPGIVLCSRDYFIATSTSLIVTVAVAAVCRYFLFLQLRRDLHHGRLLCSQAKANQLAAFVVQCTHRGCLSVCLCLSHCCRY